MSIHVALNHVTHYRYDRPIHLGPQIVRLRPAPHSRTRILSYSMRVEPSTHFVNWQQDPQANYLARLVFPKVTTFFRVEVDLVAEMAVLNPFDFFLEPSAEQFPFAYEPELLVELEPYLLKGPKTPRFAEYLASIDIQTQPTNDFLVDLNQRLQKDIAYLIRMEPGVQTPEHTLVNGSGSCRDSGWLLVQLLRHLGLAARFVSGYLIQLKSDVKSLDGPSGTEVDFTDLHAWCEVYLPGAGWIGLDPTSGLFAGEGHIPLACSPEPSSAAPISGSIDDCETTFEHRMSVQRIWESPRVTLPYTDAQWNTIDALGARVDADLQRLDVRLTQGGEPTFVSIDDREGGEWNTEALGPTKRLLSVELMAHLRAKYGQGGLLHFGQGKWYPGEQLPRWSLNLLLAQGRRTGVDRPEALCRRASGSRRDRRERGRVRVATCRAPGRGRWQGLRSLRRCLVLPVARRQAAGQRRSLRFAPRRCAGAQAPAPRLRARPRGTRGLRPADRPRPAPSGPVAIELLVPARPALLPDPRRFADRLSPAARFAALGRARRPALAACARPDPAFRAAAAAGGHPSRRRVLALDGGWKQATRAGRACDAERVARRRSNRPAALRIGWLRRSHRDQRRAAQRPPVRLHAAGSRARGLSRSRRRG